MVSGEKSDIQVVVVPSKFENTNDDTREFTQDWNHNRCLGHHLWWVEDGWHNTQWITDTPNTI